MAYDTARFRELYLGGLDPPIPVAAGWSVIDVTPDRTRLAIEVVLESESARLRAFVEPRVEGAACFAATGHLQVSYYPDAGIADSVAGRVLGALVGRLRDAEERLTARAAASVFGEVAARDVTGQRRTFEVRINRECNEACLFCNTPAASDTILPGREQILQALERGRQSGFSDLTVTGREPTLDPLLPEYLRAARALGFRVVRVQTNGTAFASATALSQLVDAGMTCAEVSLHTLDRPTFRSLVGDPRLLDKTWEGLRRLATFPSVYAHLVVVLTRLNAAEVPELIGRVVEELPHVREVTLSPVAPVGDGRSHLSLLAPFAELRAPLGRALLLAEGAGLRAHVPSRCGLPLCAMPEGTARFNDETRNEPGQRAGTGKVKLAVCGACAHETICTGVWAEHLRVHGEGELSPRMPDPNAA